MEKVAPSERFRRELDEVLAGVGEEQDPIETVGRLGARLILQQALEDEVSEFLGRSRYERAEDTVSHRNGYEPKTVKTTSGAMRLERPRVRNASKLGFQSRVLGKGVARTHALESLVISSFLRGLSTRDVEAALEEVFEEPIASRSTVSRICEDTRERYRQWCRRRLEQHDIVYCGAARSFVRKTWVSGPRTQAGSGDVRLDRYLCWDGERLRRDREYRAARFRAALPRRGSDLRGVGGCRAATRCARA